MCRPGRQSDNQTHNDGIQVHLGKGLRVANNRFGRRTRVADCAVIMPRATGAVASTAGNVWEDTGAAVRIRTNGA